MVSVVHLYSACTTLIRRVAYDPLFSTASRDLNDPKWILTTTCRQLSSPSCTVHTCSSAQPTAWTPTTADHDGEDWLWCMWSELTLAM